MVSFLSGMDARARSPLRMQFASPGTQLRQACRIPSGQPSKNLSQKRLKKMKIVTNDRLIKRNAKIGQYTSLGALVVLGIGLYITFKYPTYFAYSLAALLIGFIMSQIGIHFTNRWGRNPHPDEIIDKSLK